MREGGGWVGGGRTAALLPPPVVRILSSKLKYVQGLSDSTDQRCQFCPKRLIGFIHSYQTPTKQLVLAFRQKAQRCNGVNSERRKLAVRGSGHGAGHRGCGVVEGATRLTSSTGQRSQNKTCKGASVFLTKVQVRLRGDTFSTQGWSGRTSAGRTPPGTQTSHIPRNRLHMGHGQTCTTETIKRSQQTGLASAPPGHAHRPAATRNAVCPQSPAPARSRLPQGYGSRGEGGTTAASQDTPRPRQRQSRRSLSQPRLPGLEPFGSGGRDPDPRGASAGHSSGPGLVLACAVAGHHDCL